MGRRYAGEVAFTDNTWKEIKAEQKAAREKAAREKAAREKPDSEKTCIIV
jgi:hypothetical protein